MLFLSRILSVIVPFTDKVESNNIGAKRETLWQDLLKTEFKKFTYSLENERNINLVEWGRQHIGCSQGACIFVEFAGAET